MNTLIHSSRTIRHAAFSLGAGLVLQAGLSCFGGEEVLNGFDLEKRSIPLEEIRRGGPPRDGIPSIDDPKFVSPDTVDFLMPGDRLISVTHQGEARAYPIRILDYHEVVNDAIGDFAFVVTYCPLCGTGMVFDRTIGKEPVEFGVSGLLYQSDVLLYDRRTESLWSQIGRKAVAGPLTGFKLTWIAAAQTTWADWRKEHPDGKVLSADTGFRRNYSRAPYQGYEATSQLYFPVPIHNRALENKKWVWGLEVVGEAMAYPENALEDGVEITDTVGGRVVVIRRQGGGVEAVGEDGEPIPVVRSFWFAWQAFHPETGLWKPEALEPD